MGKGTEEYNLYFKRRNNNGPVVMRHITAETSAIVWTAGEVSEEAILIVGCLLLL